MAISLFACLLLVACLASGIVLIVSARPRNSSAHDGPACGNCGYDLTGSTSVNRCPECGKLFIEAGIIPAALTDWRMGRLIAGIILAALPAMMILVVWLRSTGSRSYPIGIAAPYVYPVPASAPAPSRTELLPSPAGPQPATEPAD